MEQFAAECFFWERQPTRKLCDYLWEVQQIFEQWRSRVFGRRGLKAEQTERASAISVALQIWVCYLLNSV
jgi:hypothetical protein